jgi:hypothetical protein
MSLCCAGLESLASKMQADSSRLRRFEVISTLFSKVQDNYLVNTILLIDLEVTSSRMIVIYETSDGH